jgi:hypothetical protein
VGVVGCLAVAPIGLVVLGRNFLPGRVARFGFQFAACGLQLFQLRDYHFGLRDDFGQFLQHLLVPRVKEATTAFARWRSTAVGFFQSVEYSADADALKPFHPIQI